MSNQRPGSTIEFKSTNKEEKKLISFNEEECVVPVNIKK